jgi:uncharacterized repeat protein (TIGR01451 family)
MRLSYKGGDGNDVTLTVVRRVAADLAVALSAQPSPASAGELLVYTVTVTNLGPDASSGVHPTMGTPVGTTFVSATGPSGWTCFKPTTSASVTCNGPTLAAGLSAVFTFTYRVNAGAGGSISATAAVLPGTNDANSGNNAATLLTPIGGAGERPFKLRIPGLAADSVAPVSHE